MGKRLPQLYYVKMKISSVWVLLQSESPWQRNDAITFFKLIFVFLSTRSFFLGNRLREYVPAIIASIMAKFEQILWESFRNILKRSFKNHKNSEIATIHTIFTLVPLHLMKYLPCLTLIFLQNHIQEQVESKFIPRIKMNHNMYSHPNYRHKSPEWAITLYQYSTSMCVYIHFTYLLEKKPRFINKSHEEETLIFYFN